MNYQLITTDTGLKQICTQARQYKQVALDTEFVRTRTYYPQLGLIQLYDGEQLSLIDPLAITDWAPFQELLSDRQVIKFLHAGSEDLEVFLNAFGITPEPFIDTQILAAFLGKPLSYGFAALVADYMDVALDKSESRTDWIARPLSEKQCDYAAADVFYLLPMAIRLVEETQAAGWMSAAQDECRSLCQRKQEILAPELAYREIGNAWQLRGRNLACLQRLAEWRLRKARERDSAVNFIVREENLWQVARFLPASLGELDSLGLSGPEIRYHGKTLLSIVEQTDGITADECPEPLINLIDYQGYKRVFKDIKAMIQSASERSGLSTELLASRRQINRVLNWHWKLNGRNSEPEMLTGWRNDLFGDELRAILQEY
ncbi:ribonuclease D [Brenneria goodwinii]|uniref:Ribonuclease D n=1 Tax=Brenneria goodwinii TaxID=1109412 RepID=A0A0G4K0N9_9GAMM|nr:ribonuclease D [Brenneria goodwinii]ATA24087.1 ribonuclease D [Brenneria goodwinii]MCG8155325.1 ribonuclease D [Brenneria goodwinii]MCG8159569.1 ribonuclease D [Brenneria goodwinii]MCG8164262.1 ribonuclease D [Brenneria goodwinii]MCG8169172.1 ribonuclease D [Brenneria goodwinii]